MRFSMCGIAVSDTATGMIVSTITDSTKTISPKIRYAIINTAINGKRTFTIFDSFVVLPVVLLSSTMQSPFSLYKDYIPTQIKIKQEETIPNELIYVQFDSLAQHAPEVPGKRRWH